MLNSKASRFMRPEVNSNRLVTFDPWNSNVLERKFLSDTEHNRLREQD
jgi:hypothetical protein